MAFVKRSLKLEEHLRLDLIALGIENRRIPPQDWSWAVDEDQDVFFTQLISSTYEMREGWYWYLLLVSGSPTMLMVDGFAKARVDGCAARKATIESSACPASAIAEIKQLAREAHRLISAQREDLLFSPTKQFPE
jgi:hypothetical protein